MRHDDPRTPYVKKQVAMQLERDGYSRDLAYEFFDRHRSSVGCDGTGQVFWHGLPLREAFKQYKHILKFLATGDKLESQLAAFFGDPK